METNMLKTKRKMAMIAGLTLLLMAIIAGFAYGYAFKNIYVAGSGASTLQNLSNSKSLFDVFQFSFIIILILDIVVSVSLYYFFKQASKKLSLASALFRLIYTAFLATALLNIFLVNNAPQNEILVMSRFKAFMNIWSLGLILFGVHLFLLSLLIFKSDFAPNVLGILVLFASVCYITTHSANLLMPGYVSYKETIDAILSIPMAIGELGLALWLILRGGKSRKP